MKKSLLLVGILSTFSIASADDIASAEDNRIFNDLLVSKGFAPCQAGTYYASFHGQTANGASQLSQKVLEDIYFNIKTKDQNNLEIKSVRDTPVSIIWAWRNVKNDYRAVTRQTYLNGYSFLENCLTHYSAY